MIKRHYRNHCQNGKRRNLNGFTFPELLISIAIFLMVVGAVFTGYSLSQKAYRESEKSAETSQNGRVILERLTREIRQARIIVTELSDEESGAISTIFFEDGHIESSYHYIRYFKDGAFLRREVVGYYFSGDPEKTLVPWNSIPPQGQTLEEETLEAVAVIGEYVTDLKIWGSRLIKISLVLVKQDKTFLLKTEIYGRNL